MQDKENQTFIDEAKRIYYQVSSTICPAFGGQVVVFNYHGFYHLMFKHGKPRSLSDRMRRMRLFERVIPILKTAQTFSKYYSGPNRNNASSFIHSWTFTRFENKKRIRIIIRQIDNGNKHFFSVMDRRSSTRAQAPKRG